MQERKVEITPKTEGKTHHRIDAWGGDHYHNRYIRMETRRANPSTGEETQVEIMIIQSKPQKGARTTTICGGFVLTPEEARELAYSLAPELRREIQSEDHRG